jgi:hypothetical protein
MEYVHVMKPSNLIQYSATIAIAGLLLGGCSNTRSQFAVPNEATQQQRVAAAPILTSSRGLKPEPFKQYALNSCGFVGLVLGCVCMWGCNAGCNSAGNWTLIDKLCPAGANLIQGIACGQGNTDPKILNAGLSNGTVAVAKWKKGQYVQVGTLTGLTGNPTGIANDFKGNVWVTSSPSATISEFYPGATYPSETYTDSNLTSLNYIAVDKRNDIYVEGQSASSGGIEIDELQAGGKFTSIAAPGQLGYTAGGLAVILKNANVSYIFVNDQGTASIPAAITKWLRKGGRLINQGSFQYSGIDTAISADPSGRDTTHVWAANNVPSSSGFVTSGVEYAFPSGGLVANTPTTASSSEAVGIAMTTRKP